MDYVLTVYLFKQYKWLLTVILWSLSENLSKHLVIDQLKSLPSAVYDDIVITSFYTWILVTATYPWHRRADTLLTLVLDALT